MNLEVKKAKRGGLGPDPGEGGQVHVHDTDDPGADHDADQLPETGGALKAHAENAPVPGTEAEDLEADPETERRMIQGEEDPERLRKATAQPGGHAAGAGDVEEVEVVADPLKGESLGLHLPEDKKRRRKGTGKETGTARVKKNAAKMNVNAPPAKKRKVKTKRGRENQMGIKEMLRLQGIMMKRNKATTAMSAKKGRIQTTLLCLRSL